MANTLPYDNNGHKKFNSTGPSGSLIIALDLSIK
jgi:hypothetical protein